MEKSQCSENTVARMNPRRMEAFQLTPNDEEEVVVISTGVVQPRRRKQFPLFLFLAILLVTIFVVTVRENPDENPDAQEEEPLLTVSIDNPDAQEDEPLLTVSIDCPPPSTKSSDLKYLLEGWKTTGCHRMECLSDRTLQNTRDRLSHSAPLCRGQALCNGDDEEFPGVLFQFGLTPSGALVWQKCDPSNPSETKIITFRPPDTEILNLDDPGHNEHPNATPASMVAPLRSQLWFQMAPDATWKILTSANPHSDKEDSITPTSASAIATVVWEQTVQNQPRPVQATPKCLSNHPVLDCPYIHFRRHGDIVMNYIDAQDGWVACKSRNICYSDLWE